MLFHTMVGVCENPAPNSSRREVHRCYQTGGLPVSRLVLLLSRLHDLAPQQSALPRSRGRTRTLQTLFGLSKARKLLQWKLLIVTFAGAYYICMVMVCYGYLFDIYIYYITIVFRSLISCYKGYNQKCSSRLCPQKCSSVQQRPM